MATALMIVGSALLLACLPFAGRACLREWRMNQRISAKTASGVALILAGLVQSAALLTRVGPTTRLVLSIIAIALSVVGLFLVLRARQARAL